MSIVTGNTMGEDKNKSRMKYDEPASFPTYGNSLIDGKNFINERRGTITEIKIL